MILSSFFKEDVNQKDQNLRRNAQEIETLSFFNTQLKSRLEILQQELNETGSNGKSKKGTATNTSTSKSSTFHSYHDDVLAQELEQKIQQYETMHRRVCANVSLLLLRLPARMEARSTVYFPFSLEP